MPTLDLTDNEVEALRSALEAEVDLRQDQVNTPDDAPQVWAEFSNGNIDTKATLKHWQTQLDTCKTILDKVNSI